MLAAWLRRGALAVAALFCVAAAAQAPKPKGTPPGKETIGLVTELQLGDVACYVRFTSDAGASFLEFAGYDFCELDLVGRRVRFTYSLDRVQAFSCRGDPGCTKIVRKWVIVAATVIDPSLPPVRIASPEPRVESALQKALAAAEGGDAGAMFSLGDRYEKGTDVAQDFALAWKWQKAAAELGHVKAQSTVGRFYSQGKGVPADVVRAHYWMSIAAAGGSEVAANNRRLVTARMSAEQMVAADELFAKCKAKNFIRCE